MRPTHFQRKSHRYDEDRFVIGKNFYMVIDGATPLVDNNVNLKPTEASWFVGFIKKRILSAKKDNIVKMLNEISKDAYKEYLKYGDVNPNCLPSAGIAWVEINGSKVDCYYIGDCEIVLKFKNKKLDRLIDERLPELDKKALNSIIEYSKENKVSVLDATKKCKDILIKNRQLMNKPNGYPIYTISDIANFDFNHIRYDLDEIEEIYLYTDGITQAFDELKIYSSYTEMFSKSLVLKEEVEYIVNKALKDKKCNEYPRFKTIDDITIIKLVK